MSLELKSGGHKPLASVPIVPPFQLTVNKEFIYIPLYKDKSFLHQKYVVEGLSIDQISQQIFSSKEVVRSWLMRHEIDVREQGHHHGRPAQPRYGQKMRKGQAVIHQIEQRAVNTIKDLKQEGLSLRKIAKILDQMKIPTKCRGKKWHPEMVKRVLSTSLSNVVNTGT
ncbi:hypothetical protein HN630_00090 [archaeon]|jgi:hypothetical protein|nr:hypothetical protein [archaeon]